MLITKYAQLPGEALAIWLHMGSGGHHQSKAARCAHFQPAMFLVRQDAVGMALLIGQRREHQPIGHRLAPLKRHRGK